MANDSQMNVKTATTSEGESYLGINCIRVALMANWFLYCSRVHDKLNKILYNIALNKMYQTKIRL